MDIMDQFKPIIYRDKKIYFLDQTLLPEEVVFLEIDSIKTCFDAIKELKVRGAPAIGIAAAYGYLLSSKLARKSSKEAFLEDIIKDKEYLASSRPTAVNLFWALDRMDKVLNKNKHKDFKDIINILENEAILIQKEEEDVCRKIGNHGLEILKDNYTVLTHCNAGFLATSKYGTALAPIYRAKEEGLNIKVFADETRPLLQGSRLTAFELDKMGIDVTVITDSMAAVVMKEGLIDVIIVGCDRAAINGDIANKIGTYNLAVLADFHKIPFYVAVPKSTFDLSLESGDMIPIEERGKEEICFGFGKRTCPSNIEVYNPAFDVTPNKLITGIITEDGILRAPFEKSIKEIFKV